MMELNLTLDFACCGCGDQVGVVVRCEGKGLASESREVARVAVPCPTCATVNQVYFEPSGRIRKLSRGLSARTLLEPSLN